MIPFDTRTEEADRFFAKKDVEKKITSCYILFRMRKNHKILPGQLLLFELDVLFNNTRARVAAEPEPNLLDVGQERETSDTLGSDGTLILSHRIRLDPNNVQATFLKRCAGTARFVFNFGRSRWKEMYEAGGKPGWMTINKELNANKTKDPDLAWLRDLPWAVQSYALKDLGAAFTNFFRRVKAGEKKPGYPNEKKRGRCREGFGLDARRVTVDKKRIRIPKLGWVRMRESLRFQGRIISARVTKSAEHWYVSLVVEVDKTSWAYHNRCKTQATVGVDLGVKDLAVMSDGTRVPAPRSLRKNEAKLRKLNKELSRRAKGGKNREKTKKKLARLHARIANIRRDTTHKLTAHLVREYRVIGIEDLNIKGMMKNRRIAKSVADASMYEVRRQLEYKAKLAGSKVVVADRWYASSKTCSTCGAVLKELPLSVRRWTCDCCGAEHDRDINAATNLRNMAAANAATACSPGSAGSASTE